jgi:hypothetical protein
MCHAELLSRVFFALGPFVRWIQCPHYLDLFDRILMHVRGLVGQGAASGCWKRFFWGPRSLAMDGQDFHISLQDQVTEKRPVLDCLPYQLYSRQIRLKSPFWAVCKTNPKRGKRCLMAGLVYTNNFVETYNSKDVCNLIFHHLYFFKRGSIQHSPCLLLDVLLIAP